MAYAAALAERPGKMIPELCTRKYDIDATYDLLDQREVVPDAIQASHRRMVMGELRTPGRYLLLEDTTFPSFSHRKEPIPGLGPIGDSEPGQQGFLLHSVLAVRAACSSVPDASGRRPPVTILGLADQQYLIRVPRDPGTSKQAGSRQRQVRDRESDRWLDSGTRIGRAPSNPAVRWVRVADREADIHEYMSSCRAAGHGFVIRVSQNRILLNPADGGRLGLVFEHIAAVPALGGMYLDLRGRDGQAARRAKLLISCGPVRVRAPERAGRTAGTGEPIDCWFIRVWEEDPPDGVEALEWVLYTDWPTESLSEALLGVMDYATRFLIEEFHKCLKTGMKVEDLQLERGNRLFAAIAVMSVVALRLLDLRELGRSFPAAPAACAGLDELELEMLRLAVERQLRTVADVVFAVGRLGGHMNRRRDGMPGWITLWRGMQVLRLLVRGAKLERARINAHVHYQLE
jgi:Transposase Tn5 dimerisation domain